jgi:hypothetical protein
MGYFDVGHHFLGFVGLGWVLLNVAFSLVGLDC